jgi:hypothetical protein
VQFGIEFTRQNFLMFLKSDARVSKIGQLPDVRFGVRFSTITISFCFF